jgi:hypothetical protein
MQGLGQGWAGVAARGWIAWYRGRAVSSHPDLRVLGALMAAEGLAEAVCYTHAEDGLALGLAYQWPPADERQQAGAAMALPLAPAAGAAPQDGAID